MILDYLFLPVLLRNLERIFEILRW